MVFQPKDSNPYSTKRRFAVGVYFLHKYTPTADDTTDINNGLFPRGMHPNGDPTHLNSIGYRVIAYRVWKKFKQYEW